MTPPRTRPVAPALLVEDLALGVGGASVVDGVGFQVMPGEVLALVGESGCGKSLTAQAAMRLLPRAAARIRGRVLLEGQDLYALPERKVRRLRGRRISMIFQEPLAALDPLATVGTQVAEATGLRGAAARAAVLDMLAQVGISDPARRIGQYPFELSGGMAQRVMIATALVARPAVLIADEPTTALDVTIQAQILELLRRLAADRGTAVLLITHDMGVVADIADRVAVMYAGRIAETGRTGQVFAAPRHPYTALLLAALPRLTDVPKSDLAVIPGQVPQPGRFPPACRFADRCPLVTAHCRAEQPPLAEVDHGGGQLSACWHADQVDRLRAEQAQPARETAR